MTRAGKTPFAHVVEPSASPASANSQQGGLAMKEETVAQFASSLRGPVIVRDHPDYEEARKLYNAMIDKRPRLIARCADAADVIVAVNFGRDNKLQSPSGAAATMARASPASTTAWSSTSRL
jgi:hypothetical protein